VKYKVGDMFLIHHGNTYSRGILTEIETYDTEQPEGYHIAWFDNMVSSNTFRTVVYNTYEIRNNLITYMWQHCPI
jgi:hypothetical protein